MSRVFAVVMTYERGQRTAQRVIAVCASLESAAREVGKLAIAQTTDGSPIGEYAYHIDPGGYGKGFEVVE